MGYRQMPVLGVNLGRLGFLADLTPDEAADYLPKVMKREYRLTHHLMFNCTQMTTQGPVEILGLNEVVVRSGPPFKMIDLELVVDGETVSRFLGDGFIIATPVGSTAHSLSAGGPVLGQELPAFVITPICGHTLTNRPLIDSADKTYAIRVRQAEGAWIIVDGQSVGPLNPGDAVTVRKAQPTFQLVKVPGKTYYQTLREKLRWGTTPNYRGEQETT
jgi:NAD+ kinase